MQNNSNNQHIKYKPQISKINHKIAVVLNISIVFILLHTWDLFQNFHKYT